MPSSLILLIIPFSINLNHNYYEAASTSVNVNEKIENCPKSILSEFKGQSEVF